MVRPRSGEGGSAGARLFEMYERQAIRPSRRALLAPVGGAVLMGVHGISLLAWLGLGPAGLRPEPFGFGFALPFVLAGLAAGVVAVLRLSFRVAVVGATLSIFAIGPLAIGLFGGLGSVVLIMAAGDDSFRR